MSPTRTCLVCGAGTVMPESSYCFTHFQDEPAQEAPEAAQEPFEAQGQPAGQPAQEEPEAAQEPFEAQGAGQPAMFSKQYASKLHNELRAGKTSRGQPLTEELAQSHLVKLKRRALGMSARGRAAELVRIGQVEKRFLGHLAAAAECINAHTTAALEPLLARSEGRIPQRREGQTAPEGNKR